MLVRAHVAQLELEHGELDSAVFDEVVETYVVDQLNPMFAHLREHAALFREWDEEESAQHESYKR